MPYYAEEALIEFARDAHERATRADQRAREHRRHRADYLRQLRERGWTNQRLATLLGVTEGAIRKILKEEGA